MIDDALKLTIDVIFKKPKEKEIRTPKTHEKNISKKN
jgi:hypothetical protein